MCYSGQLMEMKNIERNKHNNNKKGYQQKIILIGAIFEGRFVRVCLITLNWRDVFLFFLHAAKMASLI